MTIEPGMSPAERIKLFRRRAGLTQEQAAGLKGCTVSGWRKWESGERQVTALSDWIDIARILRVRDLYRLTGLPVGNLPDEQPEHETVAPIRAALHAYHPRCEDEPDPNRVATIVRFGWDSWHTSGQRYTTTGPLLPDLITQVRCMLAGVDDRQRRQAHRVAVGAYLLVRAFTKRLGAHDLAAIAADRAAAAADVVDDPEYRAAAAWNTAMVLSTGGHCEQAAAVARDAVAELAGVDDQRSERIALTGALHLLLAVQEARVREDARALAALDLARRAAGVTGETNVHRLVFGPTNVDIHHVAVCLELSRPADALRVAEALDVTGSPSIERRHTHYLDLARSYAIRRDDVASVHMLARAHRECPEESRFNLTMRGVVRDLLTRETAATRPDLRPLAETIGIG